MELYLYDPENDTEPIDKYFKSIIIKLGNLTTMQKTKSKMEGSIMFIEQNTEYYIPVKEAINVEEEIAKIEAELQYTEGFKNSVLKKLSNERFVNGAPEQVVNMERKKLADAEEKIKLLQEQLANLKS